MLYESKNYKVFLYSTLLFLFMFVLILSACGGPEPCNKNLKEGCKCEYNTDCINLEKNKFQTASCQNEVCKVDVESGCGNDRVDKGENSCNCEEDVGDESCSGRKVVEIVRNKEITTEFLEYGCNIVDECVLLIPEGVVNKESITFDFKTSYFRIEGKATYNKPFNVKDDKMEVEFQLKDYGSNTILPIKITGVVLKQNQILYGKSNSYLTFSSIGETKKINDFQLTYDMKMVEESIKPSLVIDYEVKVERTNDNVVDIRNQYEKRFSSEMSLVEEGEPIPEEEESKADSENSRR